ncbi:MAG: helix-turn-helix domain-containing protein [Allosphingosinicella sp.]
MNARNFEQLLQSLDEARRFFAGEDVPGLRVHFPPGGDVAAIRKRTGLSQAAFARQIEVPVDLLDKWETGRRCPTGPARVLLALLDKDPGIVARTLAKAA